MPSSHSTLAFVIFLVGCGPVIAFGQTRKAVLNYDESKVPPYVLPDPLRLADGTRVNGAPVWWEQRRPELLRLFETHVYDRTPGQRIPIRFETNSVDRNALGGRAIRKEVSVHFGGRPGAPLMGLLIYLLGLKFFGNHTIRRDPASPFRNPG